jgi:pimeloyl-ACP methyl ester carboxylesterase
LAKTSTSSTSQSARFRRIDLVGAREVWQGGEERSDWSIPGIASDVAAVMDAERIERAGLIGHSIGGGVVLYAARSLEDRVCGVMGAMRAMMEAGATLELAKSLQIPIATINAPDSLINRDLAADAGIEVRTMGRGGHFVMLEDPSGFNQIVGDLLRAMFWSGSRGINSSASAIATLP